MEKMKSLRELFNEQMRVLFCAEKKYQQVIPRIINKTDSEELKAKLEKHVESEEDQVNRLEQVFKDLDLSFKNSVCAPMDGIIDEIERILNADAEPSVMDAAIIAEVQKALHFKIACYGTLRSYAKMLEFEGVAGEMQSTLDEEKHSDKILTRIAQTINEKALEIH